MSHAADEIAQGRTLAAHPAALCLLDFAALLRSPPKRRPAGYFLRAIERRPEISFSVRGPIQGARLSATPQGTAGLATRRLLWAPALLIWRSSRSTVWAPLAVLDGLFCALPPHHRSASPTPPRLSHPLDNSRPGTLTAISPAVCTSTAVAVPFTSVLLTTIRPRPAPGSRSFARPPSLAPPFLCS